MIQYNNFKFGPILLLLVPIIMSNLVLCSHHPMYKEYVLDNDIYNCYLLNKDLRTFIGIPGIIVKAKIFEPPNKFPAHTCKYVIQATKGNGYFSVIQQMSLRSSGNGCKDYVQFKRPNKSVTPQKCEDSSLDYDRNNLGSYDQLEGNVETEIFVSKEYPSNEFLNLSIVYTEFKIKENLDSEEDKFVMIPIENKNVYVRKEYVCDKHKNLPVRFKNELKCDITDYSYLDSQDNTTKVTIGAVTTLILCFIIFVMCLYICKKHKILCWSSDCAGPRPRTCSRPDIITHEPQHSANVSVPVAPMLEVSMPLSTIDKDLPPSYESLFPEHSHQTSS